jgi:hypothetical protein
VSAVTLTKAQEVIAVGGAKAEVEEGAIVVRDREGRCVVRYDPATGAVELCADGELTLAAKTVKIRAEVIEHEAREVRTSADFVGVSTARWELAAGKITERAHNVFRDATGLVQTRAKRARYIVEGALSLFSKRTSVRSKEDTKIDGKRVLLG